ncbi:hypothetical protein KBZ94_41500 [Streptomyces sp. RM72]|uniref:hypothetical protein n=1 Tax=Streptomyces sp. RM72 TaxID=1115510 RepID=UPI001B3899A6|nr:hypothetical protein [Streptomyces sp. RM72]MBQ0891309.1 hypothetical protein [Streptomyces sp. RM72]
MADQNLLAQVAPRADEHGKTKDPLPERPRGPHPYPMGVALRPEDVVVLELLAGFQDEAAAVVQLASWIGAAA